MPRVVDHAERRAQIVRAFSAVVRRDGVAAASVRNVAAEGGLSPGALRHYFDSQSGLVRFVMDSISERVTERISAQFAAWPEPDELMRLPAEERVELVARVLEEVMALSPQSVAESEIWLSLVTEARTDATLRRLSTASHVAIRDLCVRLMPVLGVADEDLTPQGALTQAVVDGLTMHLTLYPRHLSRARARAALREHLAQVCVR